MPEFKIENLAALDAIPVFSWFVLNAGRTPARLIEIAARYRLIKSLTRIPSEPEFEGDLERIPLYEKLLLPDKLSRRFNPLNRLWGLREKSPPLETGGADFVC